MEIWLVIPLLILFCGAGYALGLVLTRNNLAPQLKEANLRREMAEERLSELQERIRQEKEELEALTKTFQDTFDALASKALSNSTTEFLKQAEERFKSLSKEGDQQLEGKKKLIDANLHQMGGTLKDLVEKSTKLEEGLASSKEQTEKLRTTAEGLRKVLASPQQRGKWGERMVEDILNIVGMIKGINYTSQTTIDSGGRPDYTINVPPDKKINLDVKFPIDQYEHYLVAESDYERNEAKKQFLRQVKAHLKSVTTREYINPDEDTVDYIMVFIPNESIYGFIHQSDPELLDFALKNHIILCSPITLYAVISLVHHAVGTFAMEAQTNDFMKLLFQFQKQWDKYVHEMEKMGGALDRAKDKYDALVTTRTTQLEKPLRKIQELQEGQQKSLLSD
ncbi:MAG: DNA recombination protein RmuC [Candidatus Marinimicrobia bacterium]|nr:DNA recombination protein RmuC [Candidatus Neomarinimicrobiota bacterium]